MRELYERPAAKMGSASRAAGVRCAWDRPRRGDGGSVVTRLRLPGASRGPAKRSPRRHRRSGPIPDPAHGVASSRPGAQPPVRAPVRATRVPPDRVLLVALLGWCTAIAVIDAWVVTGAVLLGLLVTGPLIAAWRASSATTAVVGGYAVLLALILGFQNDMFLSVDHLVRVGIVTLGSALCVMLARSRERLERAEFRHSLVVDAGEVLSSALDYEVTLIGL